jgi:YHS domain-containing protein
VKTLGDAVMIRCDSAADVIALALRMVQEVGTRHGFPSVRVGLSTGPAVERDGDWFGSTVNLAARLSGVAAGGEVLLTAASAGAAGAPGGRDLGAVRPHRNVVLHPRGRRSLRNVAEPVELFEASCERSRSAEGLPIDPVCRMAVDPENAAGTLLHEGAEYHFCSLECARQFAEAPSATPARPRAAERYRSRLPLRDIRMLHHLDVASRQQLPGLLAYEDRITGPVGSRLDARGDVHGVADHAELEPHRPGRSRVSESMKQ